jgi:alginate O-acetyltransferase complex protein AlgJ
MTTFCGSAPLAADSTGTAQVPSRPQRRRRLASRLVIVLLAVVFFGFPAFGYFTGVRAHQIENRALSPRPSLSEGWGVFSHLDRWTSDHLPFRDSAIRDNTYLDQAVFDETPAYGTSGLSQVVSAGGGWLFLSAELQWACAPTQPVATTLRNATRLARMVRATGARYVLLVPPDKTSVEQAELPARYQGKECGQVAKKAFWTQIEAHPPEGYQDLYQPLLALREQTGRPVYKSKDTHWAPISAGLYARTVVNAVQPGLWDPAAFVPTGRQSQLGDLSRFTGIPADNSFDGWAVRRAGVPAYPQIPNTPAKAGRLGVARLHARSAAGAPLYRAPTLVIGDSFNGVSSPALSPYFANITSVSNNSAPKDPEDLARMILSSRVVIVEAVERAFATGRALLFTDAFLDSLQRDLDLQGHHQP